MSGNPASARPGRLWWPRTLVAFLFVLALLAQAAPVSAAPARDAGCVLACSAKTRKCARYLADSVPRGYRVQIAVPPGYKLVKGNTACDGKMCSSRIKSICAISPVGRADSGQK